MTLLINPGSHIGEDPVGWTNTFETAKAHAEDYLRRMRDDGILEVKIVRANPVAVDGRWTFTFRHRLTGVEVELETHGIDNLEAYRKQNIFTPRVYWNGSSSANPTLDDFAGPGFRKFLTFIRMPVDSSAMRPAGDIAREAITPRNRP